MAALTLYTGWSNNFRERLDVNYSAYSGNTTEYTVSWTVTIESSVSYGVDAYAWAAVQRPSQDTKRWLICDTCVHGGSYAGFPQLGGTSTSGSFRATGGQTLTFWVDAQFYSYSWIGENSATLWLPSRTSACSAPSSVSASGIITPKDDSSGSFTVSWSGASGGTNNTISSYQIYYKVSSNGAAPTTSDYTGTVNVTSTATSGSIIIKPSSVTRGYKIVCGVVTQGSAGSSYYSNIKTGGSITINTLPGAPSVSVNKTSVPSTGGNVTFTVTAGSTGDTGQTATLYYAVGNGSKTSFTSPLTLSVGATTTYNFYTFDGLEYSSATAKTITKNTQPSLSVASATTSTYKALGSSSASYTQSIQLTINGTKTGTVTVTPQFARGTSTTFTDGGVLQSYSLTAANTNKALNNYDINKAAASAGYVFNSSNTTNLKWRLKLVLNDGVENSSTIYYPDSGNYTLAGVPTTITKYNQFANSNITGTTAGQVGTQVRVRFYNDESVTTISTTVKSGTTTLTGVSQQTAVSGNYRNVDLTLPSTVTSEATLSITINMTNSSNSITKTITTSVTETKFPSVTGFSHGMATIKPFSTTGTFEVFMGWPFGSASTLAEGLAQYNCSETANTAIEFVHRASSNSGTILNRNSAISTAWAKDGSNLKCVVDAASAYGFTETERTALNIGTYAGSKTYYAAIRITNLFGQTFVTTWTSRTFNFDELANTLSISSVQWATTNTSSTTWNTFTTGTSGNQAQETLYLKFNLSFKLLTTDKVTVNLQLNRGTGTYSTVITKSYAATELSRADSRTAVSNSVSLIYGPISNIADTNNRKWKFQIVDNAGTVTSSYIVMKVAKQTDPQIDFSNCSVNTQYVINYTFSVGDTSNNGTLTYRLYADNANLSGTISPGTSTITALTTGWVIKVVSVKCTSTVSVGTGTSGPCIPRTVYYYSNTRTVYQLAPTIAYRKNQLGINTNTIGSQSVIDIYPTTNIEKVRLVGTTHTITFDINAGTISGAIINSGTLSSSTNTITLKNGSTVPTISNIASYELGYNTNNSTLYINDNGTIRPIGNSSLAQMALNGSYTLDELTAGNLVVTGNASFSNNLQVNTINGDIPGIYLKLVNNNDQAQSGTSNRVISADNNFHDGKLRFYLASNSMTINKPPADGQILHLPWDNGGWDVQLAITHGKTPTLYIRGEDGTGSYGNWRRLARGNTGIFYGTSSTAAATGEKSVTCTNFYEEDFVNGVTISVKFSNTNTVDPSSLKLSINDITATSKQIRFLNGNGRALLPAANYIYAGPVYQFVYDGNYWVVSNMNYDTDTKLEVDDVTSKSTYYPILGISKTASTRRYDTDGFSYYPANGTTNSTGVARLRVGNSKNSTTDGNKQGYIRIYGPNTGYGALTYADTTTTNKVSIIPATDGTLINSGNITSYIKDYITSQGTSGNWTYKVWNSGFKECWYKGTVATSSWNAWGNVYEAASRLENLTFPVTFSAIPSYTATVSLYGTTSGGVMAEFGSIDQTRIEYIIPIRPGSPAVAPTTTLTYRYQVYVWGT